MRFRRDAGLFVPEPHILDLKAGRLTRHGRELIVPHLIEQGLRPFPRVAGGSGTLSNYAETHVLEHLAGKTSFTMPASVYLCLLTVVPDSSKTGATVTNATYTGYVPLTLAGAWNAASSGGAGAASSITNSGTLTFAGCAGGSSTITAWCIQDNATAGAGNVLAWGSATSTVISTTQTPPTVTAAGLTLNLT